MEHSRMKTESGDNTESSPFVASLARQRSHRRGLQEEAGADDDSSLSLSSPQIRGHNRNQQNVNVPQQAYLNHEATIPSQHQRPQQPVQYISPTPQYVHGNNAEFHSGQNYIAFPREETNNSNQQTVRIPPDHRQQPEWVALEAHPKLQYALLEGYRKQRDEDMIKLFYKHRTSTRDDHSIPPKLQSFLEEQMKAFATLTFQRERQNNQMLDHSFSSVAMGVWVESDGGSSAGPSTNFSSDKGVTQLSPDVPLQSVNISEPSSNSFDMDSRFSETDYMTDIQWKALHAAMTTDNGSVSGKWQEALTTSASLPPSSVLLPQTASVPVTVRQQQQLTGPSEDSSEYTSTGIRTAFICSCCFQTRQTRGSSWACSNLSSPHIMCRHCTHRYLWNSLSATNLAETASVIGPNLCRVPCFGATTDSSRMPCRYHVHIDLRRLMDPSAIQEWQQRHRRQQSRFLDTKHETVAAVVATDVFRRTVDTPPPTGHAHKALQLAMKDAMSEIKHRNCVVCNQTLAKDSNGCNRLTCATCGATSCYVCRMSVPARGYDHFEICKEPTVQDGNDSKCPLVTNNSADRERELEEMRSILFGIANKMWEDNLCGKIDEARDNAPAN